MKSLTRISAYEEWNPQFSDGSGWNTSFEDYPYFYEELSKSQAKKLKENFNNKIFKVTCLIEEPKWYRVTKIPDHKNTYFVKGKILFEFLAGFFPQQQQGMLSTNPYSEKVLSIEIVKKIPSMKHKLK